MCISQTDVVKLSKTTCNQDRNLFFLFLVSYSKFIYFLFQSIRKIIIFYFVCCFTYKFHAIDFKTVS
jgi:hypothetical protein